jgi:hypothetical protein
MARQSIGNHKTVETLTHVEATRRNIPTAEYESGLDEEQAKPIRVAYERRNRDLDPQLVWRGKDEQDWSDLVVQAPPLYNTISFCRAWRDYAVVPLNNLWTDTATGGFLEEKSLRSPDD